MRPPTSSRRSNVPRRPVGIEAGDLAIEFGRDKVMFPVKATGEHYTLHLGPQSGVLDVHRTWSSPEGHKCHETLFAIRYSDLAALFAEFTQFTPQIRRLLPRGVFGIVTVELADPRFD